MDGAPSPEPDVPAVCQICGHNPISTGTTKLLVCEPCRQKLIRRSGAAWEARLEFAHGLQCETTRQYAAATMHYERVKKSFPSSVKIDLRLAHVALESGERDRAAAILVSTAGRDLEQNEIRELNGIGESLVKSGHLKTKP